MRAIVVCGAHGGVGKTTVAVHLARALEGLGERTVVVDLDPVGHALAAVAPLGGSGGGVLAVMTSSGAQVAGTAGLLGRVPPGAVLGLVVNRVGPTRIGASHHDLGRRLGVPVLARVPSV